MECLRPLLHRLVDLANHPLGFFLLTHDLYTEYAKSFTGRSFIHSIPSVIVLIAVLYRLYDSERVNGICRRLKCRMHGGSYFLCNLLCLHWLLNLTLVLCLSLQDFVFCASSYCRKDTAYPDWLWWKTQKSCEVSPTVGLVTMAVFALVGAFVIWKSNILFGYIGHRLRQRHALADWLSNSTASTNANTPVVDGNDSGNSQLIGDILDYEDSIDSSDL